MAVKNRGVDLFSIAGIRIAVDSSWLIVFLLVLWSLSAGYFPHEHPGYSAASYWLVGMVATLLFFSSVLVHELSHALVANSLGQDVRRITLFIFGGMAHLTREPTDAATEFKIAVVGPLTSLALGAALWGLSRAMAAFEVQALWVGVFRYLGFINVALGVFNLLPGFPLDGGRLLRAFFWQRSGNLRTATARAADWGAGIATGLMVLGALQIFAGALIGGLWLIFIAMFLRGAARAGYQGVVMEHALRGSHVADLMVTEPVVIDPETTVEEAIEEYFLRHGYGGFPVVRNGRVEGVISLGQVRHCAPDERGAIRVRDIMRPLEATVRIAPTATVADALQRMAEADLGRLLVMDGDRLIGLITRSGVARFVSLKTELEFEDERG